MEWYQIYIPLCFYLYSIPPHARPSLQHLHSTMFLLIRAHSGSGRQTAGIYIPLCFYLYKEFERKAQDLNSIYIPLCFYLYYRDERNARQYDEFTFHYVSTYTPFPFVPLAIFANLHSTMFLLIPDRLQDIAVLDINLHSTMFLLIRKLCRILYRGVHIYIPLCFYLYLTATTRAPIGKRIYIPLCFYLYTLGIVVQMPPENLHSTMFLLIPGRTSSPRY